MGKTHRQLLLLLLLLVFLATLYTFFKPNAEHRPPSTLLPHADVLRCSLESIDAFDDEVMLYDRKPQQLECPSLGADVHVAMGTLSVNNGEVDAVYAREIKSNGKFGKPLRLLGTSLDIITKDDSGAIMNIATQLCVLPMRYYKGAMLSTIPLIFSRKCKEPEAQFHFSADGFIKHKDTGRCWAPRPGLWSRKTRIPPKNTPLVLSTRCEWRFDIIRSGVIQLRGAGCVHNLEGMGKPPKRGQRLGIYPTCTKQHRLKYRWYMSGKRKKETKHYSLNSDMSHVKVKLMSHEYYSPYIDTFALTVVPKNVPKNYGVRKKLQSNIVVVCIEESSAQHLERHLERTMQIVEKMEFTKFNKHAAISSSTKDNFLSLIYGYSTTNQENKNGKIAVHKADSIFKLAKEHNFVTSFGALDPGLGSHIEKKDTKHIDHNTLPFYRSLKRYHQFGGYSCYCMAGLPIYDTTFNYTSSFLNSYPNNAKLAIILLSEVCNKHFDNYGYIDLLDKSLAIFLQQILQQKETILVLQTLKAGSPEKLKKLEQTKHENKRPFLAAYVSKDIRHIHDFEMTRSDQVSTVYDIHRTLRHLISEQDRGEGEGSDGYGNSLLRRIPSRNCSDAHIPLNMCPCLYGTHTPHTRTNPPHTYTDVTTPSIPPAPDSLHWF